MFATNKITCLIGLLFVTGIFSCGDSGSNTPTHVCGNGAREISEECDDGNLINGDGCNDKCLRENAICGNWIIESTEQCDDGNKINGDGCDSTCFIEQKDADAITDLPDISDFPDIDLPVDIPDVDAVDIPRDLIQDDTAQDLCMGDICPIVECDLWTQEGCDFAEKCTISGIDRVCIPAGTNTEGQKCLNDTACAPGLGCLSNGGSSRVCYRYCRNDFDCFGTGSLCVYDLMYGNSPIPGVKLCSKACDPISNIGCSEGFSCMIYQEAGGLRRYLTDCDPHSGEGRDRDSCSSDSECAPGFFCMPFNNTCTRYCRYPTGYCVVGTCHAFDPHVILGSVEYGYCIE